MSKRDHGGRLRSGPGRLPSFTIAGPESLQALFEFPSNVLSSLVAGTDGQVRRQRLLTNLARPDALHLSTDYSGMDTIQMAFQHLEVEMKRLHFLDRHAKAFRYYRASDISPLCRSVLGTDSSIATPSHEHIFGDLNDRLGAEVRSVLDSLMPDAKATKSEQQVAMQAIKEKVIEVAPQVFTPESTAPCHLHGGHCRLQPLERKGWAVNAAGHTCVAWSPRGGRSGEAHPSSRAFSVWSAERHQLREDIVFAECSSWFPPEVLQAAVPSHTMVSLFVGPDLLGWPVRRQRVFNVLLNPETTEWVGPPNPTDYQALFSELFSRNCLTDADIFLCAPGSDVCSYYAELMEARRCYLQVRPFHARHTHRCSHPRSS